MAGSCKVDWCSTLRTVYIYIAIFTIVIGVSIVSSVWKDAKTILFMVESSALRTVFGT